MVYFETVYIEKEIRNHPRTKEIVDKFPKARNIFIDRYMDVFGRGRQDRQWQKEHPSLILAKASGQRIYPGAVVCQNFGSKHFYYVSSMKNCLYDCEYCYLKGMYSSGYVVIFVNLEDILKEAGELAQQLLQEEEKEMYLSVSFDTDLMAFDAITGYAGLWADFAGKHPNVTVEIRTKGAVKVTSLMQGGKELPGNLVFAYTLSPQSVIDQFEHRTASLKARLISAANALQAKATVRFCFDPMIYTRDWQREYEAMIEAVKTALPLEEIRDASVGTFRISSDYLKRMRTVEKDSPAVQFPFETKNGYAGYPKELEEAIIAFMEERLVSAGLPEEKIYRSSF
jgi:spore photoproduct lyase